MKKLIFTMFSLTAIILLFPVLFLHAQTLEMQKSILMNKEENEEFKRQREKWIEDMHRVEPGVNWRIIEQENQNARIELRNKAIDKYLSGTNYYKKELFDVSVGNAGFAGKWIEKGSNNQAGRIHTADIDFDNDIIYAASAGGNIWRGTIGMQNWICLDNGLQFKNIRLVKALNTAKGKEPLILVAQGGPAAFYYTKNSGLKWEKSKGLETVASWGSILRPVIVNGTNNIYVLCNEWDYNRSRQITTIYKSTDLGQNFKLIKTSDVENYYCDIWTPRYDRNDIYFIRKDTISIIQKDSVIDISTYQINNGFNQISQILLQGSVVKGKIELTAGLRGRDVDSTYIYFSADSGKTMIYSGAAPARVFETNSFMVSHSDPQIVLLGSTDLWRSYDGGASWETVNGWGEYYGSPRTKLHADIPGVMNFRDKAGQERYLIGTDGGLFESRDDMQTVNNLSLNKLAVSQYYSSYTYRDNDSVIFAGSQDQGFQRCLVDSGTTLSFEQTISGDYGHLSSSDGGTHLWFNYPGFTMIYIGANNKNYQSYNLRFPGGNWLWFPPVIADMYDVNSAFLISGGTSESGHRMNSLIWKLKYNGTGIVFDSTSYDFNNKNDGSQVSAFTQTLLSDKYQYALTNNGAFYYSSDAGANWNVNENFKGPGAHYFYGSSAITSASKLGKLYVAGSGYSNAGCYLSNDHGMNFTPLDSGLPKTMVYSIDATPDDDFLFAATEAGPYVYIAAEKVWYSLASPDSPDQTFWGVEYIPKIKTARFCTYGRGIWDFKITNYLLDVKDINPVSAQKASINVIPNPIKNNSVINISIVQPTFATIKIYDMAGKMVNEIFKGELSAGTTDLNWNGTSYNGTSLPAGNYLLILTHDGRCDFQKIVKSL